MNINRQLVLASASPRRLEIFRKNGIEPLVMPADIEENDPITGGPADTVMYLAYKKAMQVASLSQNALVVASDTIVYSDHIIGKPKDRNEALRELMALSGKAHWVYTGVAIVDCTTGRKRCFAEGARVYFKAYTEADISAYLDTDEPYDKAGGYAIQGTFGRYIERLDGDLNNVIGFPWDRFMKELALFIS